MKTRLLAVSLPLLLAAAASAPSPPAVMLKCSLSWLFPKAPEYVWVLDRKSVV